MIDYSTLVQASVVLAGFLLGISTFLPKGLSEEWAAYTFFLLPSPILFLLTVIESAYENPFAVTLFIFSTFVLIIEFVALGFWKGYEVSHEHKAHELIRQKNAALIELLGGLLR